MPHWMPELMTKENLHESMVGQTTKHLTDNCRMSQKDIPFDMTKRYEPAKVNDIMHKFLNTNNACPCLFSMCSRLCAGCFVNVTAAVIT